MYYNTSYYYTQVLNGSYRTYDGICTYRFELAVAPKRLHLLQTCTRSLSSLTSTSSIRDYCGGFFFWFTKDKLI